MLERGIRTIGSIPPAPVTRTASGSTCFHHGRSVATEVMHVLDGVPAPHALTARISSMGLKGVHAQVSQAVRIKLAMMKLRRRYLRKLMALTRGRRSPALIGTPFESGRPDRYYPRIEGPSPS